MVHVQKLYLTGNAEVTQKLISYDFLSLLLILYSHVCLLLVVMGVKLFSAFSYCCLFKVET